MAEVVDATGKITPTANGLSSATSNIESAVADFKARFVGDISMRLLRRLLEAEGYSVKPDRHMMKKLGARARDCCAYHEMMGSMYGRVFSSEGGSPDVFELKKMSEDWTLLHEFLDT